MKQQFEKEENKPYSNDADGGLLAAFERRVERRELAPVVHEVGLHDLLAALDRVLAAVHRDKAPVQVDVREKVAVAEGVFEEVAGGGRDGDCDRGAGVFH